MTVEPVDWALAERTAARIAGRGPSLAETHRRELTDQFDELTARAEDLVAAETGLRSSRGPARSRIVDRVEWSQANVGSLRRMLAPITDKLGQQLSATKGPVRAAQALAGVEVGALLGWMSARVLGQYDLLLAEESNPEAQDLVYVVGTNVLLLEQRFGFPPEEFRMWLALHECTHRAQFTGIPWMRDHFVALVHEALDAFDPDPHRFLTALRRAASGDRTKLMADGGLLALLATPEQLAHMQRIGGLMSLLEGHGDVTMNRAAREAVPSAARFARVLAERRRTQPTHTRIAHRLLGLEAKMAQYEQGETFIAAIELALGPSAIERCWAGPEFLPDLGEIRDPQRWLGRVTVPSA